MGADEWFSAVKNFRESAITAQLAKGVDINQRNADGETALHIVCRKSCSYLVQLLVEKSGGIFARDSLGRTPLHNALQHCQWQSVAVLLEASGDDRLPCLIAQADSNKETPFHYAATAGVLEIFMQTKKKDFYRKIVKEKDANDRTVLHAAATPHRWPTPPTAVVDELPPLFDVNVTDKMKMTPLHVTLDHLKGLSDETQQDLQLCLIKALLKADANLQAQDINLRIPLDCAIDAGRRGIAAMDTLLATGHCQLGPTTITHAVRGSVERL